MNNHNVGGKNYPLNYNPQQPVQQSGQQSVRPQQPVYRQPSQPVYQQPVYRQPQPVRPVQPARPAQPVLPVQTVPQPVRPVYQQPVQPRQMPQYAVDAKKAVGSMNMALFVLFSVIFGWICGRSLLSGQLGVGMTAMGVAFYSFYLPFILHKQKKKFSLFGWLLFIPQIIIFASFTFFSDARAVIVGLIASFLITTVQTTLLANCTTGKPFTFDLLCDTCINYLALPFMNIGTTLAGIFLGKEKGDRKNKNALKIAIGVAISLPVVLILIMLFAFADQMFARWVDRILTVLNLNPFRITADILFTLIVMLYVMPLVVSLRSGFHKQYNHKQSRRFFDPIITATVLFASSVIYLVFVAVQFTYLFAGIGSLPSGLTLAEYSRRGFFELVFVIVITTIVVATVCMLTKNNQNDRLPVYVKIALLIITASNGVMIISAARRLLIYIGEYKLTVMRFNAAVLIGLMAVVVIVVALRILFDRLRVSAVVGSILALTAAAYCLFNVEGFVAKYNVSRYLENPDKEVIDVDYIARNLSVAAVPQLERLMNQAPNENIKEHAKLGIAYIIDRADLFEGDERHIARWTLDRQRAVDIFEKHHITWEMSEEYFNRYVTSYYRYFD